MLSSEGKDVVLTATEVTGEELAVDNKVSAAISGKAELKKQWGHTLYHIDDIPFKSDLSDLPNSFTPFKNEVEKSCKIRKQFATPKKGELPLPQGVQPTGAAEWSELPLAEAVRGHGPPQKHPSIVLDFEVRTQVLVCCVALRCDAMRCLVLQVNMYGEIAARTRFERTAATRGSTMRLPSASMRTAQNAPHVQPSSRSGVQGGEAAALARLDYYLWRSDVVSDYFNIRNGMLGGDYSTKLSAWLSAGCLSPRTVYHEVKRYEAERKENKSTHWVVFELTWRDFYRLLGVKHSNAIFFEKGITGQSLEWNSDGEVRAPALRARAACPPGCESVWGCGHMWCSCHVRTRQCGCRQWLHTLCNKLRRIVKRAARL
jgi:deoxyribodipyrimidine photolyase